MNRSTYWTLCEDRLSTLCTRIELRGALNILDFHLHSEDFYLHFLNLLYGYALKNLNQATQNVAGIDLIDTVGKIVLQVSATATKAKIESALTKDLSAYKDYRFKFISISKDASVLRKHSYTNPHELTFTPNSDIYDVKSLLNDIAHLEISKQKIVYDFLKKELGPAVEQPLPETNLAEVISILAKENLSDKPSTSNSIPFNVDEKLTFNNLDTAALVIEDYMYHHPRIERIYAEFDIAGMNKSKSVLDSLRTSYIKLSSKYSGDELFFQVVEHAIKTVQGSANHVDMPLDELELCVNVLAVDAFVRCKIFKKPKDTQYAPA